MKPIHYGCQWAVVAFGCLFVIWVFFIPPWGHQAILTGVSPYTVTVVAASSNMRYHDMSFELPGVPKHIVLTYKSNGPFLSGRALLWKKLNPGFTVVTFNNSECEDYLEQEYNSDIRDIFKSIKDGPIKADMFRVFFLFNEGGVYVDADMVPLKPIIEAVPSIFDPVAQVVVAQHARNKGLLNPTFMAASPRHPTLKKAAQIYMTLSRNTLYTYWSWSVVHVMSSLHLSGAPVNILLQEKCPPNQDRGKCGLFKGGKMMFKSRGNDYDSKKHVSV